MSPTPGFEVRDGLSNWSEIPLWEPGGPLKVLAMTKKIICTNSTHFWTIHLLFVCIFLLQSFGTEDLCTKPLYFLSLQMEYILDTFWNWNWLRYILQTSSICIPNVGYTSVYCMYLWSNFRGPTEVRKDKIHHHKNVDKISDHLSTFLALGKYQSKVDIVGRGFLPLQIS